MPEIFNFGANCGPTISVGGSLQNRFDAAEMATGSLTDGLACGFHDFALEGFAEFRNDANIPQPIESVVQGIGEGIIDIVSAPLGVVGGVVDAVRGNFQGALFGLVNFTAGIGFGAPILHTVTGISEGIGSVFSGIGNGLSGFGSSLGSGGFGGFVGSAISGIGSVFSGIGSFFSGGGGGGGGGGIISSITSFFSSIFPVVLDLDGDGIELISFEESEVRLDFDGDGVAEQTGFVGPDDGVLLFDADSDGTFSDINEIAFVSYLEGAETDLEGLAFFDINGDGVLDETDAIEGDFDFDQFKVFQDANSNGISDEGELITLREAGITSIDLALNGDSFELEGNTVHNTSTFTRDDGTTGSVGDVAFRAAPIGTSVDAVEEGAAVIESDLGVNTFIIGDDVRNAEVVGDDSDDFFIFESLSNVFYISGGEGEDTAILSTSQSVDDFNFRAIETDRGTALVVLDTVSGENVIINEDVEFFSIGNVVYETADYLFS